MNHRFLLLVSMALLISACALPRAPDTGAVPEPMTSGSQQIDQLITQARELRDRGSYHRAQSTLEQGLRIDSRNALLWYEMASLRLDQGMNDSAEDSAQRAIRFSRENQRVAIQSWLLIAEARKRRGDEAGAGQAMEQARTLSREQK